MDEYQTLPAVDREVTRPVYDWMFLILADEFAQRDYSVPPKPSEDPLTASEWYWRKRQSLEAITRCAYRMFLFLYGLPDGESSLTVFSDSFWPAAMRASRSKEALIGWNPPPIPWAPPFSALAPKQP